MKEPATLEFDEKLPVWGAALISVLTVSVMRKVAML